MLCFELQNRLCPGWERGVWHPGAGWCAVPGAFSLPLKCSVMHQGLGWRGDGSAVRWLMQRAALGFAACSAGRCSVLRFLPLSCGLAGGEDCRSLFFLSHKQKLRDGIHRAAFPASGLMAVCVPACGGERGVAPFSCWRPMLFPGRRHPFRRGIRWRGGNPVSARSGACCSSRCGLWSRARGCLHPHRSG